MDTLNFLQHSGFIAFFLPRMSFAFDSQKNNSTLLRVQVQVRVGPLGARLNRKEFDAVRKHMEEEGQYIKKWAEKQEENPTNTHGEGEHP